LLAEYACYDVIATWLIKRAQDKMLQKHPIQDFARELHQLRYNLTNVELVGCRIDLKETQVLKDKYDEETKKCERVIRKLTENKNLNVRSTAELGDTLFGHKKILFGLNKRYTRKGGISTDKFALEDISRNLKIKLKNQKEKAKQNKKKIGSNTKLHKQIKLIDNINEYRKLEKYISTYLNTFLAGKGRLHTNFTVHLTRTGRLSSKGPNLQNIPRKGDIRNCFIAEKGCLLVEADLSQAELRIAAEYSEDQDMLSILNDPKGDIHTQVGQATFKKDDGSDYDLKEFLSGEKRANAKIVSFSTIYGKTAITLANDLDCSIEEAAGIINFLFEKFPGLRNFVDNQHVFVMEHGYVETLFGRRLHIPNANSNKDVEREAAFRQSVNYPIQSSAGDCLVIILNRIMKRMIREKWPAQLLLTVHDSLLFNVEKSFKNELITKVKYEMERKIPYIEHVKFYTDIKAGYRWGTAKKVKL
jgi:DNA polymerase-1